MSQKLAQVLKIDPPHELKFQGPFKDVVTSHLRLTNPSGRKVCFKVKTTAPRRYCVRPNSGVVDSQSTVNISVMLQPFDSDPNELLKHKFMIQTMFAPEIVDDLEALWKDVQPSDLMDSKLRCVFEQPAPDTSLPDPVSSSNPSSLAQGSELQAIMEENRRLQAENAKLRLDNEELLGRPVSGSGKQGEDLMTKQKRLIIIFLLLAFVTGITLGYILS